MDNQINKKNEVEQWLNEFNNAISLVKSKKDVFYSLSNLFITNRYWKDLLGLTWKVQIFSEKENIIENKSWILYNKYRGVIKKDLCR